MRRVAPLLLALAVLRLVLASARALRLRGNLRGRWIGRVFVALLILRLVRARGRRSRSGGHGGSRLRGWIGA